MTWVDVSAYVRGFSIRRGRQTALDRDESGQCTVMLDNRDRRFEPLYTGGAYSPDIVPGKLIKVEITVNPTTYTLFHGLIDDWQVQYDGQGVDSLTTCVCSDWMSRLAQMKHDSNSNGLDGAGDAGAQIDALLDDYLDVYDVGGDTYRDLDTGESTLSEYNEVGGNLLDVMRKYETSEGGRLFVSKDGKITFRSRLAAYSTPLGDVVQVFTDNPTGATPIDFVGHGLDDMSYGSSFSYTGGTTYAKYELEVFDVGVSPDTFKWRKDGGAWSAEVQFSLTEITIGDGIYVLWAAVDGHAVSDSWMFYAGGIGYSNLQIKYDFDSLYNKVTLESYGDAVTDGADNDATSIANNLLRHLTYTDMLNQTADELTDMAAYVLAKYKDPVFRFAEIQFSAATSALHLLEAINRELGQKVIVVRNPPGGGDALTQTVAIEGMAADVSSNSPTVTWSLSPWDQTVYWVLGESTLGIETYLFF